MKIYVLFNTLKDIQNNPLSVSVNPEDIKNKIVEEDHEEHGNHNLTLQIWENGKLLEDVDGMNVLRTISKLI